MKTVLLVLALLATSSFAFVDNANAGGKGRKCGYYGGYGRGYTRTVVVNRGCGYGYGRYYRPYYARPVVYAAPAVYAPVGVYYGGPRVSFYAGF